MSVFSIIKRGRAQAKEHSAKQVDKDQTESVKLPYKHVPTHAATDAIATAPASWKQNDRSKIREQNRRRSAMMANGTSHSGLPRVGSSLANVSYPSVYATPVVPLPKNYSYSSIPSSWRERMASTPEASEGLDYFSEPRDYKGKGKERPSFIVGTGAVPVIVGAGVAVGMNVVNSGGSEDEKEMRQQVMNNIPYNPEPRPPPSRDSSTTGERLHRLHPAHARKMSESNAVSNSDRHYPPPARSTYFSAPRPAGRRSDSLDLPTPPVPGQVVYGHSPSSAASSVTSIGMAISTAPSSAHSTPPPSTVGDMTASESQPSQFPTVDMAPSVIHPRKALFGGYRRTSSDTIRLPSNEPRERPQSQSQSQAPLTRGRRLSKSRPRQSSETERSASVNKIPVEPVPFTKPTRRQTETMIYELNQLEYKTPYSLYDTNPTSKLKHTRGKLSKDRPSSKDYTENPQTSTKSRWSFFSRRNSITGA
ncbi:hypothetical protein E0Z10_g1567 [Xylaria hypoxylon]|uniref:Uncharacterized protein n=1 Tax=Xylaria hypoxylon TaxID=37992 RepID=A0A4Z0Z4N0_9PEZI|nr:hypothetical protein E0Z10_g1567 [Xylaria hypoxylon]